METRVQSRPAEDWKFESTRNKMTISQYVDYQTIHFNDSGPVFPLTYGTNVDVRRNIWENQIKEIEKLPSFSSPYSPDNILAAVHLGCEIEGVNTVQVYMKVFGGSTPVHQENLNFQAANLLCTGPGEVEWLCVEFAHWRKFQEVAAKKGFDFLTDCCWPNVPDLAAAEIPIIRIVQKPGDLVLLGTGTIHWVRSLGVSTAVAWNFGAFTHQQMEASIQRVRDNMKIENVALIPFSRLIWNLAESYPTVEDVALYHLVR